jgi:hypothetical protein
MYAAREARTEVVKLLVDSKVDVNLQNKVSSWELFFVVLYVHLVAHKSVYLRLNAPHCVVCRSEQAWILEGKIA